MHDEETFTVTRIFDASGEPCVMAKNVADVLRRIAARSRGMGVVDGESVAEWLETFAANLVKPGVRPGDRGIVLDDAT